MIFIDTNYFLRFLLADNTSQHQQAKDIFLLAAQGKMELFTSTVVIFEIYWVLSSFYKRQKSEIGNMLNDLFNLEFIIVENKEVLREAISFYQESSFDLEDSFNLVFAKSMNATAFKTFDAKLQKAF